MCLGITYRNNLDQRRNECRQLVVRLLASRLGKPIPTSTTAIDNESGNIVPQNEMIVLTPETDLSRAL
jgi:hypothetical protein